MFYDHSSNKISQWIWILISNYVLSLSLVGSSTADDGGNWTILPELDPEVSLQRHVPFQLQQIPENVYSYDQIQKLRDKYKLEDFLWTGSGDGPLPSEPNDGGLAWEENGAYVTGEIGTVVLITKTMVLFKTVITTVYPSELSPTIIPISPTPSMTPTLTDSPSLYSTPDASTSNFLSSSSAQSSPIEIVPTTTLQIIEIYSSSILPPNDQKTTVSPPPEVMPTPAHDLQTDETNYSNPLYWVNTVIKANESAIQGEFQNEMQKNLAQVYASAFKRHLLSSLGVLNKNGTLNATSLAFSLRRRKRNLRWKDMTRDELDFQWLLLRDTGMSVSQIKSLATAVMNVSVAIVNITTDEQQPHVSMDYVVTVEGNPVTASAAVQDLHLITKREMEKQIGYEIIKKAEPLISLPTRPQPPTAEGAETSPWLIVAITTICLLVILIFVLMYMVWKWKHNRLGDTSIRARPQSGIEGGIINQAFLGPPSPIERPVPSRERPSSSIIVKTETESGRSKVSKESERHSTRSATRRAAQERQHALASELSQRLDQKKEISSPSSNYSSDSPRRRSEESLEKGSTGKLIRPKMTEAEEKLYREEKRKRARKKEKAPVETQSPESKADDKAERRRRRRTQMIVLMKQGDDEGRGSLPGDGAKSDRKRDEDILLRPSSASRDKITYGDLDLSRDPVAKSLSDEAKRLLLQSRARSTPSDSSPQTTSVSEKVEKELKSSGKGVYHPQTIDEISGKWSDDGRMRGEEKDRDLSESLEQISVEPEEILSREMKDAQVQTPTRIKGHPTAKPRVKSRPKSGRSSKHSSESLLSSKSEEILEIKELETSSEANPLGKMRKRFHQFLDDAFNVMGKQEGEVEEGRAKSAKVSVSHEIETQDPSRPWTSQLIREESIEHLRPHSSAKVEPKRAWTAGTQRRCQSASSNKGASTSHRLSNTKDAEEEGEEEQEEDSDKCDITSTTIQSSSTGGNIITFSTPIFPGYPVYPDIPLPNTQPGTSAGTPRPDSAVPLIEAIKLEIQRFDKQKEKMHGS